MESELATESWMSLDSLVGDWASAAMNEEEFERVLLEAETELAHETQLESESDVETETDADADADADVEGGSTFKHLLARARANVVRAKAAPAPAAQQAVLANKAPQPNRPLFAGKPTPAPAKGAQKLQAIMAKNPKLARIGQKISNKLKEVSTNIKTKLKADLAKAKSAVEKSKIIVGAKKAAAQAKRAAVKVAKKAVAKAKALKAMAKGDKKKKHHGQLTGSNKGNGRKAGDGRKDDKKGKESKKDKKKGKKGSKKNRKGKKGSKKGKKGKKGSKKGKKGSKKDRKNKKNRKDKKCKGKKCRKGKKGKKVPRSKSTKARDGEGRFVDRYKLPVHTSGKLKGKPKTKKQLSKAEMKAYKKHHAQSKVAHAALKSAKKKRKIAKADLKHGKSKLRPLQSKAKKAAKKAAKAVKKIHALRQRAAKGGAKLQHKLASRQVAAAKLQKDAIAAQTEFRAQKSKVASLQAAVKSAEQAVDDARANIHENGFDLLLDKVGQDVDKLDKSLFGKKKKAKKSTDLPGELPVRTVRRSVEVPDETKPGEWIRKDMDIVEEIPTQRVEIMEDKEIPDPKRPGFKTRKFVKSVRVLPASIPKATGPVTIQTRKEQRPYTTPDGKVVPVEVTYQVATQMVRANKKRNGGTPAGFKDQIVQPPPESGLIYKEVMRKFPVKINGKTKQVPFRVSVWSKASIRLEDVKGRSVAKLHLREVKSGAAPYDLKTVRSAARLVDGKMQIAVMKQVPVQTKRGLMLEPRAIDVPASASQVTGGKAPKVKSRKPKARVNIPKQKWKVVLEGVDDSLAQQQARAQALKAVEEDIEDLGPKGSISERHLKAGKQAHAVVDRVRENFYDHQEELEFKPLIREKHRFID